MSRQKRDIFLATCLLESIEDENYRNTKKLLTEHQANPNLLIPESNIAAIHYAAGMENIGFAEAAMKLILKCNGDPNVQTVDGETPLHVAVIWNRTLIVKMLLDHGADITIKDNDNNTPINHAISEKHFNLLPIFQNNEFEKKLQKKMSSHGSTPKLKLNSPKEITPKQRVNDLCKRLKQLELPKTPESVNNVLTPNQFNYNLKSASPLLVDIKLHRPINKRIKAVAYVETQNRTNQKTQLNLEKSQETEIVEISSESECEHEVSVTEVFIKQNLFELTKENLEKHLSMTPKKNRISLVNTWREKVKKARRRATLLPIDENELDSFISKNTESGTLFSKSDSAGTVKPANLCLTNIHETNIMARPDQPTPNSETNESYITAVDLNEAQMPAEKDLGLDLNEDAPAMNEKYSVESQIVFQTQEKYRHVDVANNVVFYEDKILAKSVKIASSTFGDDNESDLGVNALDTTSESGTYTALPTDYDTDDLRRELKFFGDVPGPITQATKRLYLKRLVRYKRKPKNVCDNRERGVIIHFSVELLKTLRNDVQSLDFIYEYANLERLMINSFNSSKKFREGNLKTSFIYLLIDPRISENLLAELSFINMPEAWRRFINAIFYVGKGKSSRPYAHLYDAIKLYNCNRKATNMIAKYQESLKLDRIIDIWCKGKGVICLPVFHNIIPAEAYTREAAIIDCLGVENLTNIKRGDYYGAVKAWTPRDRKRLGVLLLFKAMQVFMVEGESQLRPDDIVKH